MLASQRIESVVGNWFWGAEQNGAGQNQSAPQIETEAPTKRGATPTAIEWMILAWVSGKFKRCKRFHIPCRIFSYIRRFNLE